MTVTPRALSLAAGCVLDATPAETVAAAAEAGFDAVGVWVDLDTWGPATTAEVRQRLDDSGLRALDVEVAVLRPGGDDDDGLRMLDIGAALGATCGLFVCFDEDLGRTADRFARVCEHASSIGLSAVLEFMVFTAVRTLADAIDVVTQAGHPAGGVLVDPLHLARSGGRSADLARADARLFPYAQYCDATQDPPPGDQLLEEALHGRLLPGEGVLPLDEFLNALPVGAPLSVEVRSRALRRRYPNPVERARAIATASRRHLALAR
jgi:sugar phosphate isomerase/epimerase